MTPAIRDTSGPAGGVPASGLAVPAGWSATEGTLARELEITGHGLHTGRRVRVRIVPASSGGIVFRRLRKSRGGEASEVLGTLAVNPALRRAQPLCTMLRDDEQGVTVRTTEHLLAALLTFEIDHARVELDAEEIPILDGSARPWVEALRAVGRAALPAPKRFIRVIEPVRVEGRHGGDRSEMCIEPASSYQLDVRTTEKHFDGLHWQGALTPAVFAQEIAFARSYGNLFAAMMGIMLGLALRMPILRGASTSRAAVSVGRYVFGGLRAPNEFARHRVLDLVGDLAMAGAPILGRVTAFRPSHEMNYRLLTTLLSTLPAWAWTQAEVLA